MQGRIVSTQGSSLSQRLNVPYPQHNSIHIGILYSDFCVVDELVQRILEVVHAIWTHQYVQISSDTNRGWPRTLPVLHWVN